MKEIRQIRQENFLALAAQESEFGRFCSRVGISPNYGSRIKNGSKVIGDLIARRIEEALGLPNAWVDTDHSTDAADDGNTENALKAIGLATLIERLPRLTRERLEGLVYAMASDMSPTKRPAAAQIEIEDDGGT